MKIGYARVSTDDQNLAMQLDALRAAGCEKIHEDKAAGVLNGRKGLSEALKSCASGDVLVVWLLCFAAAIVVVLRLDRLARASLWAKPVPLGFRKSGLAGSSFSSLRDQVKFYAAL